MTKRLLGPAVGTGLFMALYLLLRPYGDATGSTTPGAAEAFASPWWVAAHLFGALALVSFGRLALRLSDVVPGMLARAARWAGLAGAVLVLPYYGAETFGLHAVGRAAVAGDQTAMSLVDPIRDQPAAMATFGLGLLLLAASGILVALTWQRARGSASAWPLGVMVALVLPQYYLPPAGRMAFGIVYAVAAAVFVVALIRHKASGLEEDTHAQPLSVPGRA